ncbi:hypothetical protein [Arthrobacter sp. NPDC056727]|uniref:hypothetical protein n=1 Tax=Arthrobacter sp. NPDC056727 TaxID=3345927 RepID=UPI0036719237
MPELNNDASDAAAPDVTWPMPEVPGNGPDSGVADSAVRAILDRVREVPGLPVSEHPDAYAGMHDALLAALNEEPQHEEPRPGPGAA